MARATHTKEKTHLVSLAIELSLRRSLRPFMRRSDTKFVALLRIDEKDDAFLYEEAARRLISVGEEYDEDGKEVAVVSNSLDFDRSPWSIVTRLKHCRRALIFHDGSKVVTEDIRLASDFETDVVPPDASHFRAAARILKLPELSEAQAATLAAQPLRKTRLAMLRYRPYTRVIESLLRSPDVEPPSRPANPESGPSLEQLFGYGEAKAWGLQLAEDVKDWKRGKIGWEDVDQGILLQGPPGVGKTMFASALAVSCGVPLVLGSAARWQAEGHLGDMLKAMRKFFKTAATKAPCIAFIDEVDSFGSRDLETDKQNLDYKRQVINALLECLAPADGRVGIVVVGATNRVESIDKALLRPGRFEKVIDIPLPDAEARLAIFHHHISATVGAFDGTQLAMLTRGWSGAQIEKLARDARRHSRRRGGVAVSDEDIRSAMPGLRRFTHEERFRVAVHEAGHTLLALALEPESLCGVRIEVGIYDGNELPDLGHTRLSSARRLFDTGESLANDIAIRLGGLISEKIVLGEHSTTVGGSRSSDLAIATRFATMMEVGFGFGETLTSEADIDDGSLQRYRMYDRGLATSVSDRLRSCYGRAELLLEANKDGLVRLAERLAERTELSANEAREVVGTIRYPEDGDYRASQTGLTGRVEK